MNQFTVNEIGTIRVRSNGSGTLQVDAPFRDALAGLEGFSRINVIWWAHLLDTEEARRIFVADKPYRNGPDHLGIFATRSPARPNPIMVSPVTITAVDPAAGSVEVAWIDAEDGTPLVDIKPYHGSTDRAETWRVPDWCSGWPASIEESATFDWSAVFNF